VQQNDNRVLLVQQIDNRVLLVQQSREDRS
jgi:hypothetical protein